MKIIWHQIEQILKLCWQLILEIINFIGKKFNPNFNIFSHTGRFKTFFQLLQAIKNLAFSIILLAWKYIRIIWNFVIGSLIFIIIVVCGYIIIQTMQNGSDPDDIIKKSLQHFVPNASIEWMSSREFSQDGWFQYESKTCENYPSECKKIAINPLKIGIKMGPDFQTKLTHTLKTQKNINTKNIPKLNWTKLYILEEFQSTEIVYENYTNFEADTCRWIFTHQDEITQDIYISTDIIDCKIIKHQEGQTPLSPQTLNLINRGKLWFNQENTKDLSPVSQSQED